MFAVWLVLAALAASARAQLASDVCSDVYPRYIRLQNGSSMEWDLPNYNYRGIIAAMTFRVVSYERTLVTPGTYEQICPGIFTLDYPRGNFSFVVDIIWDPTFGWGVQVNYLWPLVKPSVPGVSESFNRATTTYGQTGSGQWTRLAIDDPGAATTSGLIFHNVSAGDTSYPSEGNDPYGHAPSIFQDRSFFSNRVDSNPVLLVNASFCEVDVFAVDLILPAAFQSTKIDQPHMANRVMFLDDTTAPLFYVEDRTVETRPQPRLNPLFSPLKVNGPYTLVGHNPLTNASDCGVCGNACPAGETCVRGHCSSGLDWCLAYSPCANGGTCTTGVDSFVCICAPGWAGDNCTFAINPATCVTNRNTGFLIVSGNSTSGTVQNTFPSPITPSQLPAWKSKFAMGYKSTYNHVYTVVLWVRLLEGYRTTPTKVLTINGYPQVTITLMPGDYWRIDYGPVSRTVLDYARWDDTFALYNGAPYTDKRGTWRMLTFGVEPKSTGAQNGRRFEYDGRIDLFYNTMPFLFVDYNDVNDWDFVNITGWTLYSSDHTFEVSQVAVFAGEPDPACDNTLNGAFFKQPDPCNGGYHDNYTFDHLILLNDSIRVDQIVNASQHGDHYQNCHDCGCGFTGLLSWARFDPMVYPNYVDQVLGNPLTITGTGFSAGGYDLYNDPQNCGFCGTSQSGCTEPNAIPTCVNGTFVCNLDPCSSSPCSNGATCIGTINGYSCVCPAPFSGANCQTTIDECTSAPCANGGTCTNGLASFSCSCASGFSGVTCQTNINECASTPCQRGSSCTDLANAFQCTCPAAYSGILCQTRIDECASTPCANGGTCVNGLASYTCGCVAGYSGTLCQTNIDECASHPCDPRASCQDLVNGYSCSCIPCADEDDDKDL